MNRIDRKIKKIKDTNDKEILTVYLSFPELKTPNASRLKTEFHSLLTTCLGKEDSLRFRNAILKIDNYLDDNYDSRGKRSVAFFVGDSLFEFLEFEFPLPVFCRVDNKPYLDDIYEAIEEHSKYMVLLVDRKRARFFTVSLGRIEEHHDMVVDIVPQKVKTSEEKYYGRADKITRHIEDHLNRHLKLVVDSISEYLKSRNVEFIILGGPVDLFDKVKSRMPKNIKEKIRGEFKSEVNVPINRVFLKSKEIAAGIREHDTYAQIDSSLMSI